MKRLLFVNALLFLNVALHAQSGSSPINVRLYAGANPFRNTQWNNWNLGTVAQSNVSSGILNYADGSPSNVSAMLSLTGSVADNGANYTVAASICPDSVLRYTSYITSTRTLTIKGLDNAARYYLELYASRSRTDGQTTQFIIGNQTITISTDNNSSSAALFSAISPSNGSIVVTIKRASIYNYLNGFRISMSPIAPVNNPPVANAGASQTISLPVDSVALNGTAIRGSSPVVSTEWSQVSGPNAATIRTASALQTVAARLIPGTYVFNLLVRDSNNLTNASLVSVTVNPSVQPPLANAGASQTITLPVDSVTLNGTASPGSSPVISSIWSQVSGPNSASIRSASSLRTTAAHLVQGSYVFRLTVTDSNSLTAISTVSIVVKQASGKRIGLLGSSSAAGYFNNLWPIDSSYARKLLRYYQETGKADTLYNLAANGENIYQAMPNWFSPDNTLQPVNVYTPDRNRNISRMLALHPDIILCHYPTNNYDSLTIAQVMYAMRAIKATADSAGIPLFFVGTMPRGSLSLANHLKLIAINDSLKAAFGPMTISYYDSVAVTPRSINMNPILWLGNDSIHMNPKGHNIIFRQIINANIFSASSGLYAGTDQFIRLPQTAISLSGMITFTGSPVLSTRWRQVSGPGMAFIDAPGSLNTGVSQLVLGTYVFELSGTRSGDSTSSSTLQVTVLPFAPPVVNAGGNQTVLLPVSSAALSGTSTKGGGGPLVSTIWSQQSGPNTASIASPGSLSTGVNGLVTGRYVFRLSVTDSTGGSAYDSAVITVTAGASINVRLYGGVAPFRNSQWNNWNVGTVASQTPITSGLFNYEDGSASTVTAAISIQGGLYDNGASYTQNANMCPDTVLRFVSYITSTRTLTIRGLDNASRYYLELYGSRKTTGGQITRFSVGSQAISISTDDNTSNAAVFSSLSPSNGAIVVTISRVVVYNYINGFKITRISSAGTTASANIGQAKVGDDVSDNAADIQTYPNPVTDNLTLINRRNEPLRVEIFDISGRRLILDRQSDYTHQIIMSRLQKGSYVLLVTNEKTGFATRKIIVKL